MEVNLIKEIIEKMPKDLTNMEKARYIYIKLCRFFVYDPKYILGDDQKKAEIFNEDIDIEKVLTNEAVCSKIARAYMYLLDQIGIKNNGLYSPGNRGGHLEVAAEIDGKVYDMNPTEDLMNVKLGYKTTGFAPNTMFKNNPRTVGFFYMPENELRKIDNKIGYTYRISDKYIEDYGQGNIKMNSLYMDEVETYINIEIGKVDNLKQYIKGVHPDVDVDKLVHADLRKYKFDFLVEYINTFENSLNKIDKRDFLEHLAKRIIESKGINYDVYNGKIGNDKMLSIFRCNGLYSKEDVFYKIEDNEKIQKLDVNEMKELLDSGFKTFKEGKEDTIIRNRGPFEDIIAKYHRKINDYCRDGNIPGSWAEKYGKVMKTKYLQICKEYISKIDEYIHDGDINIPKFREIKKEFDKFVNIAGLRYTEEEKDGLKDAVSLRNKAEEFAEDLYNNAFPIPLMIEECKKEIKDRAIEQGIKMYHISRKSPEDRSNGLIEGQYGYNPSRTKYMKRVCASTKKLDANIEKLSIPNNGDLYQIPHTPNAYFLDANNIRVEEENGEYRAVLEKPAYVYYMNPKDFEPDVSFELFRDSIEYGVMFGGDWIHEGDIEIPKDVTKYDDVSSVLNTNQVVLNVNMGKDELIVNEYWSREKIKEFVEANVKNKRLRYLNGETKINDIHMSEEPQKRYNMLYRAKDIMNYEPIRTPEEVAKLKHKMEEFVKNALHKGTSREELDEQNRAKNIKAHDNMNHSKAK